MIKKYVKKPVVIEALQFTGNEDELLEFVSRNDLIITPSHDVLIKTLEGNIILKPGAYVIKGLAGEFYPCREDIFLASYSEILNESKTN